MCFRDTLDSLQVCLLDITLPFDLKNGNDGQGRGWKRSASVRSRFSKSVHIPIREPFKVPTFVVATRILGPRQHLMDCDNVNRGDWKQLQDTLVDKGWWYDDSYEHITGIVFRQDDSDRSAGPAVRIQVWQSGDEGVPTENRRANKARKAGTKRRSAKAGRNDRRSVTRKSKR